MSDMNTGSTSPQAPQGTGLAPNVASMLCYLCGLVTGIIFLVLEKENKEVRFHAWQSICFGVAYFVLYIGLSILAFILGSIAGFLGMIMGIIMPIVFLAAFVLWIICMIKAYQGEHFKLPIIGDIAEKQNNA